MAPKTHANHGRDHAPDGMDWGRFGCFQIKICDEATAPTAGDGAFIMCVPDDLDNVNLVRVAAFVSTVSSSGAVSIQIRNVTQAADMLSTNVTIDASEFTSYTAATPVVIDAANDDVLAGDLIAIDVDSAGTDTKGLGVMLVFS